MDAGEYRYEVRTREISQDEYQPRLPPAEVGEVTASQVTADEAHLLAAREEPGTPKVRAYTLGLR